MQQKFSQFTWRQWLMPRYIDGIGWLLYLTTLGLYIYLILAGVYYPPYPWLQLSAVVGVILFLVGLDRLEYLYYNDQPSWQQSGVLMLMRFMMVWLILLTDGKGRIWGEYLVIGGLIFSLLFLIGSSYGLTGMVWLAGIIERFEHKGDPEYVREGDFVFHMTLLLGMIFIFYIAYLIRQERLNRRRAERLVRELEESHRQLQTYAAQVAELATTEERNRLARDIHDSLGHYLSVINVQLEKAIAFRERKPVEADQAVRDSKRLAGEALQEVRQSVSALRRAPEPFSLVESLRQLVNDAQTGQFLIDLDISGDECGYSRQSLLTLYRAAQEGLTNVQKHAGASQVTIHLQFNGLEASMSISDNGQGFDLALTNGGYGLRGLQERLELIRGSLKLESTPGQGTRLLITVPKNPLALGEG
jgi:signal transduction histidine kinase